MDSNSPETTSWDTIIESKSFLFSLNFKELWHYCDLLVLFLRRDFVTVFKQTILGPLRFFIQPILNSTTFTVIYGNESIKFLSASVDNASSTNPDEVLELTSNIEITFEVFNLTDNEEISIGFDLKTTRGEILFGSGSAFHCAKNKSTRVACQIPGNLLNDDTYQILVYLHTKAGRLLFMKDEILTFEIKDSKREEGYLGKVNGFIRQTLNWKF